MTDRDEQCIKRFLQEQNPGRCDKAFTQRVLSQLPERQPHTINVALLNSAWTAGGLLLLAIVWWIWGDWSTWLSQLSAFGTELSEGIQHLKITLPILYKQTQWWQLIVIAVMLTLMRQHETHQSQ